jgi:hypothetical protein
MLTQAAGFALLAAISPTSLLVMAVLLGSAKPRETALAYAAGAILMSVAMAVVLLVIIRVTGLDQVRQRDPRYGLRLAIGVLGLAAAVVVVRHRPAESAESHGDGFIARRIADPSPRSAFLVGVILFAPSATFIAAVDVIATARASVPGTVLGLVVIVILSVLVVWLPLLGFLLAPEATTRRLNEVIAWLRARGRFLGASALAVGGVILLIDGILGLTS